MKRLGWLIVLFTLGCGDGGVDGGATGPGGICTAQGCGTPVTLHSKIPAVTVQELQSSTLRVCRNQVCFESSLAAWQSAEGAGTPIPSFPDPSQRDTLHTPIIGAYVFTGAGEFRLQINYTPWLTAELQDGDTYDVTLTASDGTKLVDSHQTVRYVISHPNGKDCRRQSAAGSTTFPNRASSLGRGGGPTN